jgi:hypothetical protein
MWNPSAVAGSVWRLTDKPPTTRGDKVYTNYKEGVDEAQYKARTMGQPDQLAIIWALIAIVYAILHLSESVEMLRKDR